MKKKWFVLIGFVAFLLLTTVSVQANSAGAKEKICSEYGVQCSGFGIEGQAILTDLRIVTFVNEGNCLRVGANKAIVYDKSAEVDRDFIDESVMCKTFIIKYKYNLNELRARLEKKYKREANKLFWKAYINHSWNQIGSWIENQMAGKGLISHVTEYNANDLSSLQETAIRIDKDLRYLAYTDLIERLGTMGINLYPGVQNKDVFTTFLRKQGLAKPYSPAKDIETGTVGKAVESVLQMEKAYANIVDNIQNYKTTSVGPGQLLGKNQSKQHPWQETMLSSIVKTFGEDILYALFPGERDIDDQSPLGCFDGFDTIIDAKIGTGEISVAEGNMVNTNAITAPVTEDDYDAYLIINDFYRSAHPLLRRAMSVLKVPSAIYLAYQRAYFNRYRFAPPSDPMGQIYIDESSKKCMLIECPEMGTGTRIILEAVGNSDFGFDTLSDAQFIEVRKPFTDPNLTQFWIQADFGARIRVSHRKAFQINNGTPIALSLSGDYLS